MAYSDMQARIASEIARDDQSANIANAINDAIKFWESTRFDFTENIYNLNTVRGQEYYLLAGAPAGGTLTTFPGLAPLGSGELILEIDTIQCVPFGVNRPFIIKPRSQHWFNTFQTSASIAQGIPQLFGVYRDNLRIFPVPNSVHTLIISAGLARLAPNPLQNATDTNAWLTEGEGLIREQAKLFLYRDVLGDDVGVQNCMKAIYGDSQYPQLKGHFSALSRKAEAKNMTGLVTSWNL